MVRLFCYVEGQTEQFWCGTVLRDHLAPFGVFGEGPILAATRKRHGVLSRGGGRHYLPMKNDLDRLLRQHHRDDVRFTTMFDLYRLYSDFPGKDDAEKLRHLPLDRVQKLEEVFAADINDPRFIPHIQLHEFETILFCDPGAFAIYYESCDKQIQALRAIAERFTSPEWIDDGQHTAPSKRIAELFPDCPAAKPDAPSAIATVIDLVTIRKLCPHFHTWITKLERLGEVQTSAGQ